MKNLIIVMMMILGAVTFARDFEYREGAEFAAVTVVRSEDARLSRERQEMNALYSQFHRELDEMDRGHSDR